MHHHTRFFKNKSTNVINISDNYILNVYIIYVLNVNKYLIKHF